MKIYLAHYKVGVPAALQHQFNPKELDLEFVDLKYTQDLLLDGTVEKGLDTVTFRGRLKSAIERLCGRCLKTITASVDLPFALYYETKEVEEIETLDNLREVLILDHPIAYVCKEDCKGLCPNCGVNLNETACTCSSPPQKTSGPFSRYSQVKILPLSASNS